MFEFVNDRWSLHKTPAAESFLLPVVAVKKILPPVSILCLPFG